MVDFNNESTVATAPADIIKILRLERRYNLLESMEVYYRHKELGHDYKNELCNLKSALLTTKMEIEGELSRIWKKEEFESFVKLMNSSKETDIIEAIRLINLSFDKLELTKMDTKSKYDSTRVETENRAKKL